MIDEVINLELLIEIKNVIVDEAVIVNEAFF